MLLNCDWWLPVFLGLFHSSLGRTGSVKIYRHSPINLSQISGNFFCEHQIANLTPPRRQTFRLQVRLRLLGKTRLPTGFWWNGRIPAMLGSVNCGLASRINRKQDAGVLVTVLSGSFPDNQTIRPHSDRICYRGDLHRGRLAIHTPQPADSCS